MIKQYGIKCPTCRESLFSNSRHDFVECPCGDVFIDGGFDYVRVGFTVIPPEQVERMVDRSTLPPYFRDEQSITLTDGGLDAL